MGGRSRSDERATSGLRAASDRSERSFRSTRDRGRVSSSASMAWVSFSSNFAKSNSEEYRRDLTRRFSSVLSSPSWPPHLPSPGKLEHIVQVFFNKVPFSTELLNKARFLSRLALPPTHVNFPHPGELSFDSSFLKSYLSLTPSLHPILHLALLHAICCCTARVRLALSSCELDARGR